MKIGESAIEDVLRSEDIETLFQHGAPEDEYAPEVRRIMSALTSLGEDELTRRASCSHYSLSMGELLRAVRRRGTGNAYTRL